MEVSKRRQANWNKYFNKFHNFISEVKKFKLLILTILVLVVIASAVAIYKINNSNQSITNMQSSVVDVICDSGYGGSGTIFTSDGTVLTNNHVIADSNSCTVTIPNPTTGKIAKIYKATPVITPVISEEYDIATLKIDGPYTDSDGKTWGEYPTKFTAFVSPKTCDTNKPSNLGDSVRIYGYPMTSGGYNLTITDGIISSFSNDGSILTSAKIDSGNSGGLAIDQNGCWLGIPSAVVSGNYQNLGVIIPGSIVEKILYKVTAKAIPSSASDYVPPTKTKDQICQSSFGANSEWNGSVGDNGKPLCQCQSGYSWDTTGDLCATQTSLQKSCKYYYGEGSYSHVVDGKSVCGCISGYKWNDGQTACISIAKSGYQVCSDMNGTWDGTSYTSDGYYSCTCDTGYTSSADGTSCIPQTQTSTYGTNDFATLDNTCKTWYGNDSYYTGQTGSKGGPICDCIAGDAWNNSMTACINSSQFNRQCYERFGYTAEPSGELTSDGRVQCQCLTGYYVSGGTCVKY